MKKIFIGLILLLVSTSLFASVFYDGEAEKIVDAFWDKGNVIKIIVDDNNIHYMNKSVITGIEIDEDEIEIATSGYNIMTNKNNDSESFSIKKWNITSDENGNIVITPKSKK